LLNTLTETGSDRNIEHNWVTTITSNRNVIPFCLKNNLFNMTSCMTVVSNKYGIHLLLLMYF